MDRQHLYFSESQRFRAWWLWLLLLAMSGYFYAAVVRQVLLDRPAGTTPSPDSGLVIAFLISLVILALFWLMRLETRIMADGIYTRFFPFVPFKRRAWESIQALRIRRYRPLLEYGGWGIRGFGGNRALNVSGNIGLQLHMASGDRLLIGTRQSEAMDKALRELPALSGIYSPLTADFND